MIIQTILRWPEAAFECDKTLTELVAKKSGIQVREWDRTELMNFSEIPFVKRKPYCEKCHQYGYLSFKFRNSCSISGVDYKKSLVPSSRLSTNAFWTRNQKEEQNRRKFSTTVVVAK